jgi:phosphinothricin acetyltransferase
MIRNIKVSDSKEICDIYNYYISNTYATFEEEQVTYEEMKNRIINVTKDYPWLVYEKSNKILGYAYAKNWHARSAYRYTLESTIYLDNSQIQKGIGTNLYSELFKQIDPKNCTSIISIISLPNEKSQALHEKFKFKKVGHFKNVGFKFNKWIDVGYWQKIL